MKKKAEKNQIMKKRLEENEAKIGFMIQENAKVKQNIQIEVPQM